MNNNRVVAIAQIGLGLLNAIAASRAHQGPAGSDGLSDAVDVYRHQHEDAMAASHGQPRVERPHIIAGENPRLDRAGEEVPKAARPAIKS